MSEFATTLIAWQKVNGRHDLPWQNTIDAYTIWVSEIMLQQSQVSTVIGFYGKFMQRFPDIGTLANATQEEVLEYWSGLGYYSRARNLHNAAGIIMDTHNGIFPSDVADMKSLPGIGRSTAAAIASFAFNQVETILDGNVKRVLARHFLVEGWTSSPKVEKSLWTIAESLLPKQDMVAYTQGLMDLGSTICTRSKPQCGECPLKTSCQAHAENRTKELPTPKPKKVIPQKQTTMLLIFNGNEVMLEKRPQRGIWAGLWSFPEISMHEIASEVALKRFCFVVEVEEPLAIIQHVFTHFKLEILPQPLQVTLQIQTNLPNTIWLPIDDAISAAIPAPVRRILQSLTTNKLFY